MDSDNIVAILFVVVYYNIMTKEQFYNECGVILSSHPYIEPYHGSNRVNRWTNRNPGNGRYEGIGVVRYFSKRLIHIILDKSSKTYIVKTPEEAFEILRSLKGDGNG